MRLEAITVTLVLTAFTMSGLFFLAVTVEESFFTILEPYPQVNRFGVPAGASLGILLGFLCLCRFLPDMLLGAFQHSMRRIIKTLDLSPAEGNWAARLRHYLRPFVLPDTRRGWVVMFGLLPLAIFSLMASIQLNVAAISASFGALP
jgi:hypothetical protein